MADKQQSAERATNSRRSYTVEEMFRLIDLLCQKGELNGKTYTLSSLDGKGVNVAIAMRLGDRTPNKLELAFPRSVVLILHRSGSLLTRLSYDYGMPYEVADTIPILTKDGESKLQMYEALGFPILPPSGHTFAITNGNSAYVVLTKKERCPLTNKIPETKPIPPVIMNIDTLARNRATEKREEMKWRDILKSV